MNRTTAIFLALGILLAHALSIHRDYQWHFAEPFDQAHLAYTLGENLAEGEGLRLSNHEDSPGLQAYPSPLWVGLAYLAHQFGVPADRFAQTIGLLAALLLISLSTRIAYDRVAGVIPPLLLVLSGTMACGAVCGTEHVAIACFAVMAFISFEKDRSRWFALALALLAATRAESGFLILLWLVFWGVDRIKGRRKRAHPAWVFLPAALIWGAFAGYTPPGESTGLYLGALQSGWQNPFWEQGLWHLRDFAIVAISPALVPIGILFLLAGRLSGAGIRALLLSLVWVAWVVWIGGDSMPFGLAYLPVMPLMCLVIQETIVAALDTYRPSMEAASWVILFLTAFSAATASKFPGDVGPLSLQRPHTRWLRAKAVAPLGQDTILGRTQLHSEIHNSSYLKLVAEFLGDHAPTEWRVLTPWPGHIAYRTDLRVDDWLGRLRSEPQVPQRWPYGATLEARLDHALERQPDIVLPGLAFGVPMDETTMLWGMGPRLMSMASKSDGVRAKVRQILQDQYRLHSLPIWHPGVKYAQPYFVYCRKDRGASPELAWDSSETDLRLQISAAKPNEAARLPQMLDLIVWAEDQQGTRYRVEPSGQFVEDHGDQTSLPGFLLDRPQGHAYRLLQLSLPTLRERRIVALEAQLFHAGVSRAHPLAPVGPPSHWRWKP